MPKKLLARGLLRLILAIALIGAIFFVTAGTWMWWEAWVYCVALFAPVPLVLVWLALRDPALLERRLREREPEPGQRAIVLIAGLIEMVGLAVPGLDHRFGWSDVPVWLALSADVIVVLGYALIVWVFAVNSYTSRTIAVDPGQTLATTGPYAHVRHPMYTGVSIMLLASPIALGSYVALPIFALMLPILAWRIRGEEAMMREQMPGYAEYCERVPRRLVPGLW